MSVPVMKRTRMEDGENGVVPEMYPHFATQAIHAGQDPDQWKSRAVVPLISLSTTFKQDTPGKPVSEILFESVYTPSSCLELLLPKYSNV